MENEVYEKDYGEEFRKRSDKAKGRAVADLTVHNVRRIYGEVFYV